MQKSVKQDQRPALAHNASSDKMILFADNDKDFKMSTSNDSATFAHPISDLIMGVSTSNESATFAQPISILSMG